MPSPLPIATSLWDFSLHYYARPGVSQLCLHLQDEHRVNVNILLWTLWLGYRGIRLEPAQLAQALRKTHGWDQHYVVPLRQLRRRMKVEFGNGEPAIEAVRTQIKQAELLAEKYLQQLLESIVQNDPPLPPPTTPDLLMAENLRLYLRLLTVNDSLAHELLALL